MSVFEKGKIYHGFRFEEKTFVGEINAFVYLARHEKSGARLMYAEAKDENKVFGIAFKTVPEDDTGVMHILEHSVLNGSEKYPVKEPFVELLKGSMQTFLNAMTYPDKTMYPVASCNEKDFENLMDVYLDAVFHPLIYRRKTTFLQEGWHYEPKEDGKDECFRGVVYNEMKGEMSSEDSLLAEYLQNTLFPDICYGKNSGGAPEAIPDLSYEAFLAAHERFYHPENSYIYLYGDMDADKKLAMLDEKYLSHYERINSDIKIGEQPDRGRMYFESGYDSEEESEGATHYALGFKAASFNDRGKLLALTVLLDALSSSNEAPLKKALLDRGVCEEVWAYAEDQIISPYACIALKRGTADGERAVSAVYEALGEIAEKGIDKNILAASLNQAEFRLREADFGSMPPGLIYFTTAMATWLYGGDPTRALRYEDDIASIRGKLKSGYFEELIREIFLNSKHCAVVKLVPDKNLAAKKAEAERARTRDYRERIGDCGVKEARRELEALRAAQNAEDDNNDLAKIPLLETKDVDPSLKEIPCEDREIDGMRVRFHNIETKKIVYTMLSFDLGGMDEAYLPYASLAASLLGKVGTKKRSASEVINALKTKTGSFGASIRVSAPLGDSENVRVRLNVRFSALCENLSDAMALAGEVITSSRFDNAEEITKLLLQDKMSREISMARNGQQTALARVMSYYSPESAVSQKTHGLDYYFFIRELSSSYDTERAEILENVFKPFVNAENAVISVTCTEEEYPVAKKCVPLIALPHGQRAQGAFRAKIEAKNEGIIVPTDVSFVAKGAPLGREVTGDMYVLAHILSYDYLWNTVRAKGGAYGTGFTVNLAGSTGFYSYRDPNLADTLKVYDDTSLFLERFSPSEREMTKCVIGAVAASDKPKTPSAQAARSDSDYFDNIPHSLRERLRREMLATKAEDIRNLAREMGEILDKNMLCVVSSKGRIEKNKGLFRSIITIKQ